MLVLTKTKKDFKAVVKKLGYSLDEKLFERHKAKTVVNTDRQGYGHADFVRRKEAIITSEEFLKEEPAKPKKEVIEGESGKSVEDLRAIYFLQHKKNVPNKYFNNAKWIESKIDLDAVEAVDGDITDNEEE